MPAGPRYFPVTAQPLKMAAGLVRHGTDFGQGAWDRQFFQRDEAYARYLAQKRLAPPERHVIACRDEAAARGLDAALVWMRDTLGREAPDALHASEQEHAARDPLEALALHVQEDLAVIVAGETGDRVVALDIRFPSGFRPERIAGQSFFETHLPVPGFVQNPAAAESMVRAMTERGPYVRFVWALAADTTLDHHPEAWSGSRWSDVDDAVLRVERQTTVPFPHVRASLFLIRTHLYPLNTLSAAQCETLAQAITHVPPAIRAYKRLPTPAEFERIVALRPSRLALAAE